MFKFQTFASPKAGDGHSTPSPVDFLEQRAAKASKALFKAAKASQAKAVRTALVDGGAPDSHVDANGYTALLWAANNGAGECVEMLVEAGADVNARDNNRMQTPLMLASARGYLEVVQHLLKGKAELEAVDWAGWRALGLAAHAGHLEVVKALVEAGADVTATNNFGATPEQDATAKGHAKVAALLRKRAVELDAATISGASTSTPAVRGPRPASGSFTLGPAPSRARDGSDVDGSDSEAGPAAFGMGMGASDGSVDPFGSAEIAPVAVAAAAAGGTAAAGGGGAGGGGGDGGGSGVEDLLGPSPDLPAPGPSASLSSTGDLDAFGFPPASMAAPKPSMAATAPAGGGGGDGGDGGGGGGGGGGGSAPPGGLSDLFGAAPAAPMGGAAAPRTRLHRARSSTADAAFAGTGSDGLGIDFGADAPVAVPAARPAATGLGLANTGPSPFDDPVVDELRAQLARANERASKAEDEANALRRELAVVKQRLAAATAAAASASAAAAAAAATPAPAVGAAMSDPSPRVMAPTAATAATVAAGTGTGTDFATDPFFGLTMPQANTAAAAPAAPADWATKPAAMPVPAPAPPAGDFNPFG